MRSLLVVGVTALFAALAPAQGTEWITNGTFTGTLAPWTMGGGYSVNPGLDTAWDTTGLGVSDSFACSPGGQVTPAPYPANTLEQPVIVIPGLTYEFRADASSARPNAPTVGNADAGLITVFLDDGTTTQQIAQFDFLGYTPVEVRRAQVVGRFTTTMAGQVTLRIAFARRFLANTTTPQVHLDNVSLRNVDGPTYWIASNRKIGTNHIHKIAGEPGALFGAFIAVAENPAGFPFPGILGAWQIELATTTLLALGNTDTAGIGTFTMAIPNDPAFLTTQLWYQGGTLGTVPAFSTHFGVVCTQ